MVHDNSVPFINIMPTYGSIKYLGTGRGAFISINSEPKLNCGPDSAGVFMMAPKLTCRQCSSVKSSAGIRAWARSVDAVRAMRV